MMIETLNLTFGYGKTAAIFDSFSWKVRRGEAWSVIGSSGCGKTTLLYLLAGLYKPRRGTITVDGQQITRPRPKTGLVLQDHGLLPWATVWENAYLGLKIRGFYGPDGRHAPENEPVDTPAAHNQVSLWLDRLKIDHIKDKYPAQISGGQRQRTAICRTLALEPDLLLLDEPFSALDAPTREDLEKLIVDLNSESGLTTLIVTHNIEEAVIMGRQILVLKTGVNKEPAVFENAYFAGADQDQVEFRSQCTQLRQLLGGLDEPPA